MSEGDKLASLPPSFSDYRDTIDSEDSNDSFCSIRNIEEPSTSSGSQGIKDLQQLKNELLAECNRRPFLDGTYFVPDLENLNADGTVKAACQLCKSENDKHHTISGSLKVSSNYVTHIKKMHKRKLSEYEEYAKEKVKKLKTGDEATEHRTYCSFSQARFEENVINFVLETLVPFNTVESRAFRKIFDDMKIKQNGRVLRHLSARSISRRVVNTYKKTIEETVEKLAAVSFVCTTADTWSSPSRRFIGMTVHWIDEKTLQRKSYAIACRRLAGDHLFN